MALGEDGPTHQPIEHLASFRAIPQFEVVRPADQWETAEAYRAFFEKENTYPTAMILTRQGVPTLAETAEKAKDGVKKGAYVLVDTEGTPDVIIMASGSEVQWAVAAAKTLADEGIKARVVSMVSMEWFEEQDAEYKESVLPASVKAASPSRPVWPCRGTSTSAPTASPSRSSSSVCRRRRAEHDRPRHHRRARGRSRQGLIDEAK